MAVKSLLRYLRGTMNLALCYQGGSFHLVGYSDAEGSADKDGKGKGICLSLKEAQYLGAVRNKIVSLCLP